MSTNTQSPPYYQKTFWKIAIIIVLDILLLIDTKSIKKNKNMPDDNSALIGASASLAGTALNNMAVSDLNKRAERYNWEMWNVQRQAQIQDWWRTQAYNSPENQMNLYRQAGLNPNLIYGSQGGFQGAGLQSPPSGQSLNLKQPDYSGAGEAVGKYFNIKMQQQMIENQVADNERIRAQADASRSQAELNRSNIPKIGEEVTGLKIANYINDATKDVKIAIENGTLRKQGVETQSIYQEMLNHIAQTSTSISEAFTRMVKNIAETSKVSTEVGVLESQALLNKAHAAGVELENAYMKKYGVKMPQQNFLVSMMAQFLDAIKGKIGRNDIPSSYPQMKPDDSLFNYFRQKETDSMRAGDYHKPVTK